jgi:hypothetical protein
VGGRSGRLSLFPPTGWPGLRLRGRTCPLWSRRVGPLAAASPAKVGPGVEQWRVGGALVARPAFGPCAILRLRHHGGALGGGCAVAPRQCHGGKV